MARISAHSALQRAGHPHMGVGEQKQNTKRALKRPNRGNRGARDGLAEWHAVEIDPVLAVAPHFARQLGR